MSRIFISYSRHDAVAADRMAQALERAGVSVFLDHNRLRGGASFAEPLDRAIARCDVFIVLFSVASVQLVCVHRERHLAVGDHDWTVLAVVLGDADWAPIRLAIAGLPRMDLRSGDDHQLADMTGGVSEDHVCVFVGLVVVMVGQALRHAARPRKRR